VFLVFRSGVLFAIVCCPASLGTLRFETTWWYPLQGSKCAGDL